MKLGDIVKEYRTTHKLSMEKFAVLANVSKGYISMLEKGENPKTKKPISPSFDTIKRIALAMNRDFEDLVADLDDGQKISLISQSSTIPQMSHITNFDPDKTILLHNYDRLDKPRKNTLVATSERLLAEQEGKGATVTDINEKRAEYDARKRVKLPVPGRVSAGSGYWQEDDFDTLVDFYADDIPDEDDYDTIAVVVGHSMEPKIKNGDFLFIKLADQINLNQVGIFQVNGENFVKKLKEDRLESLNPEYDDIYPDDSDNFRTIGEVVDVYREG